MNTLIRKRPAFVLKGGKYVRDTSGREITIHSEAKGNSLAKFPRRIGAISHHQWS